MFIYIKIFFNRCLARCPCPATHFHGLVSICQMPITALVCRHPGKQRVVEGLGAGEKALLAHFSFQNIRCAASPPAWHRVAGGSRGPWGGGHAPLPWLLCLGGANRRETHGFADHEFYIYTHIHICMCLRLQDSEFSLFPCNNSGRYLIAGVGIVCHRHCPERFTRPSLLVPTRCGGIWCFLDPCSR